MTTPTFRPPTATYQPPVTLHTGDCRDVLASLPADSVDAIVCDPPYGLSFMSKAWDHAVPGVDFWQAAIRVLKPGGHLLAFGGTRTFHRLAAAIEDAGFEMRDTLMWLYGSGFPKSLDVGKALDKAAGATRERTGGFTAKHVQRAPNTNTMQRFISADYDPETGRVYETAPATEAAKQWDGWGTALKPAWEPITLARKPLDGTVAANVLAHGTGALNIGGCRVPADAAASKAGELGRWPANLLLDEDAAAALDAQSGIRQAGARPAVPGGMGYHGGAGTEDGVRLEFAPGGASRFFYCPKAAKAEKTAGGVVENPHPTVKPVAVMRWLVKLVTPPGGVVLDQFMGSGTTGVAAVLEGCRFIGVDDTARHVEVARQRIAAAGA